MKYLNNYKDWRLSDEKRFFSEFSSDQDAIEDLNWYKKTISELNEKGGIVYRLVFLENIDDLNTDYLGEHWCLEESQLSNFYNSLSSDISDEFEPYLIKAYLEPGQINAELSLSIYEVLPHELEVNLKSKPVKYTVDKYNRR